MNRHLTNFTQATVVTLTLLLAACGGGGGGGGSSDNAPPPPVDDQGGSGSDAPLVASADISADNLRSFTGAVVEITNLNIDLINDFLDITSTPTFSSANNSSQTIPCDISGSVTAEVTGGGENQKLTFDKCSDSVDQEVDGTVEVFLTEAGSDGAYSAKISLNELSIEATGSGATLNGSTDVAVDKASAQPRRIVVTSNLEAMENTSGLLLRSEEFEFFLPLSSPHHLVDANGFKGGIEVGTEGLAVLTRANEATGEDFQITSLISGVNANTGMIRKVGLWPDFDIEVMHFPGNGQTRSDLGVRLEMSDLETGQVDFFGDVNVAPSTIDSFFNQGDTTVNLGAKESVGLSNNITDLNGDLLNHQLSVDDLASSRTASGDDIAQFADVQKLAYGTFDITFSEPGDWRVSIIATDPSGEFIQRFAKGIKVLDNRDTDGDGIINANDDDDDGDGVLDPDDAFPLDPSESADFDGDGIGDVADTDDDNDGVTDTEDLYPNNSACSKESDGNGEICYIERIGTMNHLFDEATNTAYFWDGCYVEGCSPVASQILRWSLETRSFLPPLDINRALGVNGEQFEVVHWPAQNRLVLIFSPTDLVLFDLSEELPLSSDRSLPPPPVDWITGYSTDGNYLIRETYDSAAALPNVEVFGPGLEVIASASQSIDLGFRYLSSQFKDIAEKGYTLDFETLTLIKTENAEFIPGAVDLEFSPDKTLGFNRWNRTVYSIENKAEVTQLLNLFAFDGGSVRALWTNAGIVNPATECRGAPQACHSRVQILDENYEQKSLTEYPDTVFLLDGPIINGGEKVFVYSQEFDAASTPSTKNPRFIVIDTSVN